MFFRSFLYKRLPESGKIFDRFGENSLTWAYYLWRVESENLLMAWHHTELLELSPDYQIQTASLQLIKARAKVREEGMRSDDPRYPVLSDFLNEK